MRRKCRLERLRVVLKGRSDERYGRLRERSHNLKRLDGSLGERGEPLGDKILQSRGHRKLFPRRNFSPALKSARNFERVERIAASKLVQAYEHRPTRRGAQLRSEDAVKRSDAERTERDPQLLAHAERRFDITRARAQGDEERNPLVLQSARDEADQERGRSVKPLNVVDRNKDGTVLRQEPERGEKSCRHGALIGRLRSGLCTQERNVERAPLRRRERVRDILVRCIEEIAQPGKGEVRLGFAGGTRENPITVRSRLADRVPPQRRLANSCLTFEDDVPRSPLRLLEPSDESSKLLFASDDLLGLDGHEPIVPQLP
jgi:hypothetical protein